MQQRISYDPRLDERKAARIARARQWSRRLTALLIVLCLTAIWQERRLAPPVHDRMQILAALAMEKIEGNEHLSEALAAARKSYAQFTEDG